MFSSVWVSLQKNPLRLKAVTDRDCLPADAVATTEFHSTADLSIKADLSDRFWHYYEKMRWLELLGIQICIDFDSHFYETGMYGPRITK